MGNPTIARHYESGENLTAEQLQRLMNGESIQIWQHEKITDYKSETRHWTVEPGEVEILVRGVEK